jgi:hypothetical protein
MAAGDAFTAGVYTVAAEGFMDLQPSVGEELVIHNIGHSQSAELQFYDGTNFVVMDTATAESTWVGMYLHCTNSKYYRVKNTSLIDNLMCADGMKTK